MLTIPVRIVDLTKFCPLPVSFWVKMNAYTRALVLPACLKCRMFQSSISCSISGLSVTEWQSGSSLVVVNGTRTLVIPPLPFFFDLGKDCIILLVSYFCAKYCWALFLLLKFSCVHCNEGLFLFKVQCSLIELSRFDKITFTSPRMWSNCFAASMVTGRSNGSFSFFIFISSMSSITILL